MTIKLAPSLVAFSLIGLTPLGQDTDHYDPDAQRKVFQTSIDWQINRLGVVFDYTTYDILAMFEPLKGETTWNLSVRDTPKREDGELVKIQRDYEDVILETQHSVSTDDLVQEPMELFGGM